MEDLVKWLTIDAPSGWEDVIVRSVKVAIVAFVVLQAKEWFDAGMFDTVATGTDALMIAGGALLLNAVFMMTKPRSSHQQPHARR
jgi:small neutral amino acid transporter SnatA (MarC family)